MKRKKENLPEVKDAESQIENNLITTLSPTQQRFIHLYLTGIYTLPKLAELLDVHYNTVRNWLRQPIIRQIISEYQQDEHQIVEQGLKALRMKALIRANELMDSPIDGVAVQVVKDILDRTGHKPKQEIKKDITVKTFEQHILDLANETIVDADFRELEDDEE